MESEDMETVSEDYFSQKFGWERKRDEAIIWGRGSVVEDFTLQWEEVYVLWVEMLGTKGKVNNKDTSEEVVLKWVLVLLSEV